MVVDFQLTMKNSDPDPKHHFYHTERVFPRMFVEYAGPLTSGLAARGLLALTRPCGRYVSGETTKDVRCLFGIYDDLSTQEEKKPCSPEIQTSSPRSL